MTLKLDEMGVCMDNSSCRYTINAVGKGGQIYLTQCKDKSEVEKWIEEHEDQILLDDIKIVDKKKHPLLKLFSLKG